MGIDILYSESEEEACLYCNTTDWAFGPIFKEFSQGDLYCCAYDVADKFIGFVKQETGKDVRVLSNSEVENLYLKFLNWLPIKLMEEKGDWR